MDRTGLIAGASPEKRLTSHDVRETTFPTARFGGVNTEQVTRFMRRAAHALELLEDEQRVSDAEVRELREENIRLRADAERASHVPGNGTRRPDEVAVMARNVLAGAQSTADQLVTDASVQARRVVEDGQQHRAAMLADARNQADRILTEAVEEAGRRAAQIAAQAPLDARREYAKMLALAETVRVTMTANLAVIAAQVKQWEQQEKQGMAMPSAGVPTPPGGVPVPPG
jgi:cell division septum initiation protein DivIVA